MYIASPDAIRASHLFDIMIEDEAQRRILLGNLAANAGHARLRLCLSVTDAARLAGLTEEALEAVEQGKACLLSLAILTEFTLFLGLTKTGLPRSRHPGMH